MRYCSTPVWRRSLRLVRAGPSRIASPWGSGGGQRHPSPGGTPAWPEGRDRGSGRTAASWLHRRVLGGAGPAGQTSPRRNRGRIRQAFGPDVSSETNTLPFSGSDSSRVTETIGEALGGDLSDVALVAVGVLWPTISRPWCGSTVTVSTRSDCFPHFHRPAMVSSRRTRPQILVAPPGSTARAFAERVESFGSFVCRTALIDDHRHGKTNRLGFAAVV